MSQPGRAREALFKHFGFTGFREGQAEVIDFVLEGHDAVVVMPTGGGKSLCYQLPAMMIDGVTLVVSPLIALMKDQVDQLAARGIPTTFINSSLPYGEMNKRLSEIRLGRHKLVYVAPERFRSDAFGETIRDAKVKLFAVDEAHCISHWGHDFRPDYLRLKAAAEQLGRPQVLALTATATPQVRADISRQLGLLDPQVFVAGFDRPNLALRVLHIGTEKEKIETLKRVIAGSGGTGIVYAATRKSVEQVAARLKMAGLRADPYHGGMGDVERSRTQDSFMRGSSQAIVATNAFGMGIDKPDIRFVVHYHVPGSIEAYYQEVGRAGRDGLPAECLLLFNYADTRTQQFFIEGNHPSPELIGEVYRELAAIGGERIELSAREMAQRLDIKNDMAVNSALLVLEKAGHIERGRAGRSALVVLLTSPIDEALAALPGDTREGEVVRDLIFTWNVTDRESAEVDPGVIATALRSYESHVRRVLGQLSARGIISYRTAYEGRGIRLIDVDARKPPRIDKRELASRAAAEQWKLRKMIDYCYHEKCLRRFILSYFGDRKQIATCGTCSNCATRVAEARQTETTTRRAAAGTLNIGRSAGPATEGWACGSVVVRFSLFPTP